MEDPNQHLKWFLQLCDMFKYNAVTNKANCLRLFPFLICDNVYGWLDSQELGSITTWDELARKFIHKFFPISRTIQLRRDIANFKQFEGKNLYEVWEQFKLLLRKCSHHGMQEWLQLQIFYNGLNGSLRAGCDGVSGGAFMDNTYKRACQLIKDMAMNLNIWPNERFSYNSKPSTAKVVEKDDKYQQILEKLHRLETTIKQSMNDFTRSYTSYSETQS
ncbi:Retrotransposon gag protein [Gossypium australe]|uniref:Retrotransposon gag protein n=1 Tax=Gossypium australe TaxID=47621 RepID=A0A5B6X987_9ROSI|nr:Retrotransposon gag protein [Gossypium australe]